MANRVTRAVFGALMGATVLGGTATAGVAAKADSRGAHHAASSVGSSALSTGHGLSAAPPALRAAVHKALYPRIAAAGSFHQTELTASDTGSGSEFGNSVALSGNTAIVGTWGRERAYVFVRSGSTWSLQSELAASDGASNDNFGYAVGISGNYAIVGAYGHSSNTGTAYIFNRSGTTWTQQAEFGGGASGDFFGYAVGILGSWVLVGAPGWPGNTGQGYVDFFHLSGTTWSNSSESQGDIPGAQFGNAIAMAGRYAVIGADRQGNMGVAYVYQLISGFWYQDTTLQASDQATGDTFGEAVAMAGSTIVVGDPAKNSGVGKAYIFTGSGSAWTQQAELPGGGASNEEFGQSAAVAVAKTGTTVLVGAFGEFSNTGAAWVFTSAGSTWPNEAYLSAADGASGDNFGYSVALSGTTALVGAPFKNSATGAAYLFTLPSQQAELAPAGAGLFGASVGIAGATAVVGAPNTSGGGSAYVFVRSGSNWSLQSQLTPTDLAAGDNFGAAVAIAGNTVVVGDSLHNSDAGAAYIFGRSGSTWSQLTELNGASMNDLFGQAVAVDGSTVLVGSPGVNSSAGAVDVFVGSGTTWTHEDRLSQPSPTPGDSFGAAISVTGTAPLRTLIGAYGANGDFGEAYIFVGSGASWTLQASLTAGDGALGDAFGESVAIGNSIAAVAAPERLSEVGVVYIFTRSGSTWTLQAELVASDATSGARFGLGLSLSGTSLLVGAPNAAGNTGAAYVFNQPGGWPQVVELQAADATAGAFYGVRVALSGSTAVVGADIKNSEAGAAYIYSLP